METVVIILLLLAVVAFAAVSIGAATTVGPVALLPAGLALWALASLIPHLR